MNLAMIRIPTLVMHHVNDQCPITPFAGVKPLLLQLTSAPVFEGISVEGGGKPEGDPCEALHFHGFIGIEGAVVARMAGRAQGLPAPYQSLTSTGDRYPVCEPCASGNR